MAVAACPHADPQTPHRMCAHLLPADQADDYAFRFTGRGVEYVLVCRVCADAPTPALVPACGVCLQECEGYVTSCFGLRDA